MNVITFSSFWCEFAVCLFVTNELFELNSPVCRILFYYINQKRVNIYFLSFKTTIDIEFVKKIVDEDYIRLSIDPDDTIADRSR
jgi:hypothetical protein